MKQPMVYVVVEVSKNKILRRKESSVAVYQTVAVFNSGAASKAVIMDLCGVKPGADKIGNDYTMPARK